MMDLDTLAKMVLFFTADFRSFIIRLWNGNLYFEFEGSICKVDICRLSRFEIRILDRMVTFLVEGQLRTIQLISDDGSLGISPENGLLKTDDDAWFYQRILVTSTFLSISAFSNAASIFPEWERAPLHCPTCPERLLSAPDEYSAKHPTMNSCC